MSQANSRCVFFNGRFVSESEARLSIYDSALVMGDMAYEVTRTYNHRPFHLRDHLKRLEHTMSALRIECGMSLEELEEATREVLRRNISTDGPLVDWSIIHNVSRGPGAGFFEAFSAAERRPTVLISCFPLAERMRALAPAYESGIDLVMPEQRSIPSSLLDCSLKTRSRVHYQLANMQAAEKKRGSAAVLLDPDGYLTEGTSGNLFLIRDGKLFTPHTRNLLPGVTRKIVLELARRIDIPAQESDITPDEARRSDEIFVTSTTIGIMHARSFEGHSVGDGRIGPLTVRLRQALIEEVGLDFVNQARRYVQMHKAGDR